MGGCKGNLQIVVDSSVLRIIGDILFVYSTNWGGKNLSMRWVSCLPWILTFVSSKNIYGHSVLYVTERRKPTTNIPAAVKRAPS
jgi:hypothetical protein